PATRKDKHGCRAIVRADRDRFMKLFFENVPRPGFDDAMLSSGDKRFFRLYDALHDDAYRNTSPGTLCRKFGISWFDLVQLWDQFNRDWAMIGMYTHLPEIMEDVAQDALSRHVVCERCDGEKEVIKIIIDEDGRVLERQLKICPVCQGVGQVRVPG